MKSNSVSKRPLEIKNGNVTVKIYTVKNRVNGASYPQFTLVHYLGTQRIKRKFADLKEARREAELVAAKLASGENEVLRLTSTDRVVYLQARAELHPLNLPLNVAVNRIKSRVVDRVFELARGRLYEQSLPQWQEAYRFRGQGTTMDRKHTVNSIMVRRVPVPELISDKNTREFLDEVKQRVMETIREVKEELVHE